VELLAAGETDEVADFLKAIEESSLASHIRNQIVNVIPAPVGLRGFEIV
jgi:acylphosphatase